MENTIKECTHLFSLYGNDRKNAKLIMLYKDLDPVNNEELNEDWLNASDRRLKDIKASIENSTLSTKDKVFWMQMTNNKESELKNYTMVIKPVNPSEIKFDTNWIETDWRNLFERCFRTDVDVIQNALNDTVKTGVDSDVLTRAWDGLDQSNIPQENKEYWMQEITKYLDRQTMKNKNIVIVTQNEIITRKDQKTESMPKIIAETKKYINKESATNIDSGDFDVVEAVDITAYKRSHSIPVVVFKGIPGKEITYSSIREFMKANHVAKNTWQAATKKYGKDVDKAADYILGRREEKQKRAEILEEARKHFGGDDVHLHEGTGIGIRLPKYVLGEEAEYPSAVAFCRAFDLPHGSWGRIKKECGGDQTKAAICMLKKFGKIQDKKKWNHGRQEVVLTKENAGIDMVFPSILHFRNAYGVSGGTWSNVCKKNGGDIIKTAAFFVKQAEENNRKCIRKKCANTKRFREIVLTKDMVGEDMTYPSISAFCEAYGISKTTWTTAQKKYDYNVDETVKHFLKKFGIMLEDVPSESRACAEEVSSQDDSKAASEEIRRLNERVEFLEGQVDLLKKMITGYIDASESRRLLGISGGNGNA